jgi:hypothetical protein
LFSDDGRIVLPPDLRDEWPVLVQALARGTFQDRLVSELRLPGATTRAAAQAVLARFLPHYNRRFARPAAEATPAWREVERPRLAHSLCFTYRRVVAKDNTVAFHGAVLPLPKRSPFVS